MPSDVTFARAWFLQRESGVDQLAAFEHAKLAALDEPAALPLIDALLSATPRVSRPTSGLSEQQRLFARLRR